MARRSPKVDRASHPDPKRGEEDFRALLRLVERADGFVLAFVRSNAPMFGARFISQLEAELSNMGKELQWLRLEHKIENLLEELRALPQTADRVVVVTGLEYSVGGEEPAAIVHRMNLQRPGFRQLGCPLLIFVPDYLAGLFGREAADLWSWKSGYFDLGEDQVELTPHALGIPADLWGYSALSEPIRRAELDYQQSLWESADAKRRIEIGLRQSMLLEGLGRPVEAKKVLLEKVLPICESLRDLRGRANLYLRVVTLERRLGHARKALKLLAEEVLPGLATLDDRLRWQAEIERAELLRELGSEKAAKRLLQKEILPAVERVGYLPEIPMARVLLANILLSTEGAAAAGRYIEKKLDPIAGELKAVQLGTAVEMLKVAVAEREGRLAEMVFRIERNLLPELEKRGDLLTAAWVRVNLAVLLVSRQLPGDVSRATDLLDQSLATARDFELPELERWQALRDRLAAAPVPETPRSPPSQPD